MSAFAVEISLPLKWRGSAYLARLSPRSIRYFTEGMMVNSVDMLSIRLVRNHDIVLFARSTIWTGMGYQYEDIVFDPRDMHYSLAPGLRSQIGRFNLSFLWYHDCFHEVDRNEEPTTIWNIYELRFSPITYIADARRENIRKMGKPYFAFLNNLNWEIAWGIFPRFKSIFWFQYTHPFTNRFEADLRLSLVQYAAATVEFRYQPTVWMELGGNSSQRQYIELALAYYSKNSAMSMFWGYTMKETQPIRPKDGLTWFGFRWEL